MTGRGRTVWSGASRAPAVKRTVCRRCGEPVDSFRDPETGLTVRLNATQVPITADLASPLLRTRLWEYKGPVVGWARKWAFAGRSWRELRARHECEQ